MRFVLILPYYLFTGVTWVVPFGYSDENFLCMSSQLHDRYTSFYVIFPNLIFVLAYFDTKHGLDKQHRS